jgi:predicted transcriptional regulator
MEKRKRGRPKKTSNTKAVTVVTFISKTIADKLTKIARRYKRSRSAHLAVILTAYCEKEEKNGSDS